MANRNIEVEARKTIFAYVGYIARSGKLREAACDQQNIVVQLVSMEPIDLWCCERKIKIGQVYEWVNEAISIHEGWINQR